MSPRDIPPVARRREGKRIVTVLALSPFPHILVLVTLQLNDSTNKGHSLTRLMGP